MSKQRRTFSPEFKQQVACLVLDKTYSCIEASRSVGVGESVLRRWVNPLQLERQGITPQSKAMTPDQQRIQELECWLRGFPSAFYLLYVIIFARF